MIRNHVRCLQHDVITRKLSIDPVIRFFNEGLYPHKSLPSSIGFSSQADLPHHQIKRKFLELGW